MPASSRASCCSSLAVAQGWPLFTWSLAPSITLSMFVPQNGWDEMPLVIGVATKQAARVASKTQ